MNNFCADTLFPYIEKGRQLYVIETDPVLPHILLLFVFNTQVTILLLRSEETWVLRVGV